MEVLHDMSLKRYNTFNIDVTAKDFVSLQSVDELQQFLSIHALNKEKFMILGGGSNILFTADYDGTIVQIAIPGKKIIQKSKDHVLVQVMAGENWDEFVSWCIDKGLGGLENLSGIPGLVGASPIQNIGAYGVEMQDHFITLEAIEANTGVVREFPLDSCSFGYRDSVFKKELKDKFIILSTTFSLDKKPLYNLSYSLLKEELGGKNPTLTLIRELVLSIRSRKLPDPSLIGNAGSFFKNPLVSKSLLDKLKKDFPGIVAFQFKVQGSKFKVRDEELPVDYPQGVSDSGNRDSQSTDKVYKLAAGWLVEQCGWKGFREGDAGVHDKQALVLVNHGHATGKEILNLARRIQLSVLENFGVELEPEVNII